MNLSVTLRHGPLNVEIEGEDREEIQENLLGFADFLEQHGDTFTEFEIPESESGDTEGTQTEVTGFENSETSKSQVESEESFDSKYTQLAQETGVDEKILSKLINLPDDEEGVPSINTYHFDEGTEVLGSARNQRQAQGSAILLYVWDVCLGEKKITYDRLDEGLIASDVETERRKNMHSAFSGDAGDWFESGGGCIWIIGPGKTHIRELIGEMSNKINK